MFFLLEPHSLLCLFFFLFVSLAPTCLSQDDHRYTACAPLSFPCGNKTFEIKYPFRVDNSLRPDFCSFPGYNLTCVDNRDLVVEALSSNYTVKSINYDTHVLQIVDVNYTSAEPCPWPSRNSTIDPLLINSIIQTDLAQDNINATFNFTAFGYGDAVQIITFYLSCPLELQTGGSAGFRRIPCLTSNRSYSYFRTRPPDESDSDLYCDLPVTVPLSKAAVNHLLVSDGTKLGAVLGSGFDVKWMVGSEWCKGCVESGGRCGYNSSVPMEPTCFCRNGKWNSSCAGPVISEGPSSTRDEPPSSSREEPPSSSREEPPRSSSGSDRSRAIKRILIGVFSGVGGLFLAYAAFVFVRKAVKRKYENDKVEAFLQNYGSLAPRRFQYSELKKMTDCFKDKLGEGGYGSVFRGKLKDGRLVAVKVLNSSKGNGEEFINEVASIGRTYHVNVVSFFGFCYEGSKRALVYEYMSNGSLEKFIYSDKSEGLRRALDCEKLFQIAVGIARGLEYLHRGCSTHILHFDIKPHNILLDDEFCPKISDFGLAKLCPKHEGIVSMRDARGTLGYTAPELFYRNIGGVSHKSDVYSYGMMVLEMVGGRKNIDPRVENTSEIYFPHWIYNRIDIRESLELIGITNEADIQIARKMVLVGLWCIQTAPTDRPSMGKVVEMLEGSLESLPMPPKPYLSSPSRSCQGSAIA